MISLCIPSYNRTNMVLESFSNVLESNIINEIIIVDDFSNESNYETLKVLLSNINNPKIKLFRNTENKKAFHNKIEAVKKANNKWIILLDSDNILTQNYIDSIPKELDEKIFYLPSRAICESPYLDYRNFSGLIIDKTEYKKLANSDDPKTLCLFNTGNYFFNKETYLDSIRLDEELMDCKALDPFYQIYLGFKYIHNFKLNVVQGMEYYHRLHTKDTGESQSYYTQNSNESVEFLKLIKIKIQNLD